ncbi:MAG: ankyrin repeat domain-containing protein [Candidatus Eremiobacteraeota bacterium]|nr:ankyrin repeat domain-containing protein [Candidatus Eremiobacteraeota bacterium]
MKKCCPVCRKAGDTCGDYCRCGALPGPGGTVYDVELSECPGDESRAPDPGPTIIAENVCREDIEDIKKVFHESGASISLVPHDGNLPGVASRELLMRNIRKLSQADTRKGERNHENLFRAALFVLLALVVIVSGKTMSLEGSEVHRAVMKGDLDKVRAYIARDPRLVNLKDRQGRTPLHYIGQGRSREMAELLISHGADTNARDSAGCTPLALVLKQSDRAMAEYLRLNGARE